MKIKLVDLEFEIVDAVSKEDIGKESLKRLREMTKEVFNILKKRSSQGMTTEAYRKGYEAAIVDLKIIYSKMMEE